MLFEDRARAESFGAVAELYDRARPSYPPALVEALLAERPHAVLDVGCGTGIAAALFAARGCLVLGVEVDARMAALARAKGLDVEVAAFERWDDRGRRFDLLMSGQAWHWIEPRSGAAKAATVLRHGARIGLFWNFAEPGEDLRRTLTPIYERMAPGLERYSVLLGNHDARAPDTVGALEHGHAFTSVEVRRFPWARRYTTAQWCEQLATHSDHHQLPDRQRQALLGAVAAALDAQGGEVEMPYQSVLVTAVRR